MDLNKLQKPRDKNILSEEIQSQSSKARLTESLMLKLSPAEKRKIEKLSAETSLKLSPLVRSLLKKHGYI